ncbi:MAG: LON peptidase substrate-binding domain-containing protein [Proteobacteria bacterium]|jgi:Lon protease-like protein|nr:LON peptidase substrate-binding domain-containing protein [Pseudomonadota bacterium]
MRAYNSIEELPNPLPIFPLSGVLLLPRGQLPLNVFEPRYLALVDSAMSGGRMIGMIQPAEAEEKALTPKLSSVGCAGRVTSYRETDDGRYLITLTGVCRFRVKAELATQTPFRAVTPDYAPFAGDLVANDESEFPRERVVDALKDYLSKRDLKADWRSVMTAPPETLVNALAMLCPFEPAEKQALLEATDWHSRVATLVALLEMAGPPTPSGGNTIN